VRVHILDILTFEAPLFLLLRPSAHEEQHAILLDGLNILLGDLTVDVVLKQPMGLKSTGACENHEQKREKELGC
jgi:hypothetical protein